MACSKQLSERFRLVFTANCHQGQLFNDIGFLGDMESARMILEGTYKFPPDTDDATRLLFKEWGHAYAEMDRDELETYVTVENFRYYWQRANERISTSYSSLHFGHYKTVRMYKKRIATSTMEFRDNCPVGTDHGKHLHEQTASYFPF